MRPAGPVRPLFMTSKSSPSPTPLGRGRSAVVWRVRDTAGREVARKVFRPDAASRLVFEVLFGGRFGPVQCPTPIFSSPKA